MYKKYTEKIGIPIGYVHKLLLVMRLTTIILIATIMQVSAGTYAQKITLSEKNASLTKIFKKIRSQSGYDFVFTSSTLKGALPVNVSVTNADLNDVLKEIFSEQPLNYYIEEKAVIVKVKKTGLSFGKLAFIKITGSVKDTTGLPLPNVSVLNKTTGKTVVTNVQGAFILDADAGDRLVFSLIGFTKKEIVVGTQTSLNVILREESGQLEQVVVTALGIKKTARSLSYSVQEIKGEELTRNKDANFVNSLVGKIAGVTINASASGIGGATRVVMRGPKSINGNNNVLYVIDGIPMSYTVGGQISGVFAGVTGSDGISAVNPDDIESISALTGAAASSLYGSAGQGGVILITTKSGKAGKTSLSYSNNSNFFNPFVMPEFQNTYGQSEPGSYYSWGEKLADQSTYKPRDFFQTGNNITNSLTFSTGSEKNQTYVSAAILNGKGIIPNNELTRYNFTVRNTSKFLNDKLTLDLNVMYSKQHEQNMFSQGLYHSPIVPIYLFPPGADIETYKAYERYDATRLFPTQFWPFSDDQFRMQNPYWITNREFFTNGINKMLTGATLKYKILDWLDITGRVRMERNTSQPDVKLYASTNQLFAGPGGMFRYGNYITEQKYFDLIAGINKKVNDFTFTGNFGYTNNNESNNEGVGVEARIPIGAVPNQFTTGNAAGEATAPRAERKSNQGLFVTGEVAYKNTFFLTASHRTEWWSSLYGTDKLYLSYPSVGTAVVVSDLLKMPENIISFAKIRANYSWVGNPPPSYLTILTLPQSNGIVNSSSGVRPTTGLRPENTKGWEVGANVKFLRNKLTLDVALYDTKTYNQLFNIPISQTSGYSSFYLNAGQVNNKGIEASLSYNGKIGPVNMESSATFTLNRNKVAKLMKNYYDDITGGNFSSDTLDKGGAGSYSMKIITGGTLSAIYTSTLLLDEHGDVVLQKGGVSTDDKHVIYSGEASPDYTIGYRNNFNYKNFNFGFVLFGRFGGVGVSATQAMMDAYGVSKTSADARDAGYIMLNNEKYTSLQDYYRVMGNGLNGVLSQYVYSATNVRLKEVSFGYTLPGKYLKNKLQSINFSVIGQNLFMFYNKAPFDPESAASAGTYYQGIDYFMQPSLRSLGFSVKAQF